MDEKYYLSDTIIKGFLASTERHKEKGTGFIWKPKTGDDVANCLRANGALCKTDNSIVVEEIFTLIREIRKPEESTTVMEFRPH